MLGFVASEGTPSFTSPFSSVNNDPLQRMAESLALAGRINAGVFSSVTNPKALGVGTTTGDTPGAYGPDGTAGGNKHGLVGYIDGIIEGIFGNFATPGNTATPQSPWTGPVVLVAIALGAFAIWRMTQ